MKTLYALIFACLSLQACTGQSETPTASTNVSEYSTAREMELPGTSGDDAYTPWSTVTGLEDYPLEIGVYGDDEGHTAGITVPATPKIEDNSINTGVDLYADEDGWDFQIPDAVDLHAIQAKDWW
jgi:hypothetical protein